MRITITEAIRCPDWETIQRVIREATRDQNAILVRIDRDDESCDMWGVGDYTLAVRHSDGRVRTVNLCVDEHGRPPIDLSRKAILDAAAGVFDVSQEVYRLLPEFADEAQGVRGLLVSSDLQVVAAFVAEGPEPYPSYLFTTPQVDLDTTMLVRGVHRLAGVVCLVRWGSNVAVFVRMFASLNVSCHGGLDHLTLEPYDAALVSCTSVSGALGFARAHFQGGTFADPAEGTPSEWAL